MTEPLKLTLALTDGTDAIVLGELEIDAGVGDYSTGERRNQLLGAVGDMLETDKVFQQAVRFTERTVDEYLAAQA